MQLRMPSKQKEPEQRATLGISEQPQNTRENHCAVGAVPVTLMTHLPGGFSFTKTGLDTLAVWPYAGTQAGESMEAGQ